MRYGAGTFGMFLNRLSSGANVVGSPSLYDWIVSTSNAQSAIIAKPYPWMLPGAPLRYRIGLKTVRRAFPSGIERGRLCLSCAGTVELCLWASSPQALDRSSSSPRVGVVTHRTQTILESGC